METAALETQVINGVVSGRFDEQTYLNAHDGATVDEDLMGERTRFSVY